MCLIKLEALPNDFPHMAHLCDFSPAGVGTLIATDVDWPDLFTQRKFPFELSTLTDA